MIKNSLTFKLAKKFNLILRFFAINYDICKKCHIPYKYIKPKYIFPTKYKKMKCMCEICWEESSLEEIKSIYRKEYFENTDNWKGVGLNNVIESIKKEKGC